jgi:hypothetical protein
MVAPITGPFTRAVLYKGPPSGLGFFPNWLHRTVTWYRQRKPYNLPLLYTCLCSHVDTFWCTDPNTYTKCDIASIEGPYTGDVASAKSKAYAKLIDDIGDASLWAVNVAEYKQSINLIAQDGIILWRFTRALHRFDFPECGRILKTVVPKGLKPTAKAFGNNFLKFHFGWEPLVKDIGAAISTLENPINSKRIAGKGRAVSTSRTTTDVNGSVVKWIDKTFCHAGCQVTVTNPNLYLAQQLGFINPLAIAWELVPFSFVADWFVNVGAFLGQMTDFAGLSVSNPYTTTFIKSSGSASSIPGRPEVGYTATYTSTYMDRTLTLPGVTLHVRPWKGVSPVRAATAISLLVQQLR